MNNTPLDLFKQNRPLFDQYLEVLLKWNQKINLTSLTQPEEMIELHFIDSLFLLSKIVSRETILDIGAGAGFPGIPLKIVRPELEMTLVDSVKKKCDFMKEVIRALKLDRINVLHRRINQSEPVGQFDAVVSRAAFKLKELIPLAIPNLNQGGILITMKGIDVTQEIQECQPLLNRYPLQPIQEELYTLPFSKQKRKIIFAYLESRPRP